MRLEEIMTLPVKTIAPSAPIAEARAMFQRDRINHLVVVDGVRPVGVLSVHDVDRPGVASVDDAMTIGIVVGTPRMTVRDAANLLRGRGVGCLPIVEGDRVVGIVTVADLLELVGKGREKGAIKPQRRTLLGRGRGPRHSPRSSR